MKQINLRYLFTAAVILTAAILSYSQSSLPNFDRPHDFDAKHYLINTTFDQKSKSITGETTVTLQPTKNDFNVVNLDAVGLKISRVTIEPSGNTLNYVTKANGTVSIQLDRTYSTTETLSIRLVYTASPKKGIYFVEADEDHSAQIWTQGEPDEARHWFPSFDFPSDKATTEQILTVDKNQTVIANGDFLGKKDESNGKVTWHFKMPVPHSVYLVSFIVGEYSRIDDTRGPVPMAFYTYPGRETIARAAFDRTADMIATFERLTGVKFPFNKYDQTVVANFQFGGMENITATTYADQEIFFYDTDFGKPLVTDLVSHELAHSWFGNLVTCNNWAELWLNEGFATFMEAAYREAAFGRENYIAKIRSDAGSFLMKDIVTNRRHGLYNLRAGEVEKLFDDSSVTYSKGGVVLHMLREEIGNEAFWNGVNLYLNRHRLGNVRTTDLISAMEQASGKKLDWFFDQWVFKSGAPRITIVPTYSAKNQSLTVSIAQTQKEDAIVPAAFRFPLSLAIKTSKGVIRKDVNITKRSELFSVKLPARPVTLEVDDDMKVPLKTVKLQKIKQVK
ncbi:MAG TPA: M1 family metallopeptidase [Pyrinomonadaceae bacterium]|nr:M1 family metallopeptidase [Pyrinomonadaceae bacterium]